MGQKKSVSQEMAKRKKERAAKIRAEKVLGGIKNVRSKKGLAPFESHTDPRSKLKCRSSARLLASGKSKGIKGSNTRQISIESDSDFEDSVPKAPTMSDRNSCSVGDDVPLADAFQKLKKRKNRASPPAADGTKRQKKTSPPAARYPLKPKRHPTEAGHGSKGKFVKTTCISEDIEAQTKGVQPIGYPKLLTRASSSAFVKAMTDLNDDLRKDVHAIGFGTYLMLVSDGCHRP